QSKLQLCGEKPTASYTISQCFKQRVARSPAIHWEFVITGAAGIHARSQLGRRLADHASQAVFIVDTASPLIQRFCGPHRDCLRHHSIPHLALDVMLHCLEPESERILQGDSSTIGHFVHNLVVIALNHVEEAKENARDY
ncbi:unnamed protein product, partial [Clonostachys chloroleuca]